MDGPGIGCEPRPTVVVKAVFFGAQFLQPGLACVDPSVQASADGLLDRRQDRPHIADKAQGDVAVLAYRAVIHVDLYDGGILAQPSAIAQAEVERSADNDDDIRLVEGVAARELEMVGIARR